MNIQSLNQDQLKTDLPDFAPGDTVKVHVRIKEGTKVRVQIFEGVILGRSGKKGIGANFTVRRIASGIGVERTFMIHSPNVLKIEVLRLGKVRRAKLYYLRDLKTRRINIKQRRIYGQQETSEVEGIASPDETPPVVKTETVEATVE